MRRCSKCGEISSIDNFYKGRSNWCKPCHSVYYRRNKARIAAKRAAVHQERMASDPEYKKRHNQRNEEWRKANREKARALKKAWRVRNPAAHAAHEAKRRARSAGASGEHSVWDLLLIFQAQAGACAYCAEPVTNYHVEHMVPLSRGGSNGPQNLAISCPPCNLSKGRKTATEFIGGDHR